MTHDIFASADLEEEALTRRRNNNSPHYITHTISFDGYRALGFDHLQGHQFWWVANTTTEPTLHFAFVWQITPQPRGLRVTPLFGPIAPPGTHSTRGGSLPVLQQTLTECTAELARVGPAHYQWSVPYIHGQRIFRIVKESSMSGSRGECEANGLTGRSGRRWWWRPVSHELSVPDG